MGGQSTGEHGQMYLRIFHAWTPKKNNTNMIKKIESNLFLHKNILVERNQEKSRKYKVHQILGVKQRIKYRERVELVCFSVCVRIRK
jgi:hypothetical protein